MGYSSLILVEEPSMFPFLPLRRESLKERLPLEILTWEEKILITVWLTTSSPISRESTERICPRTRDPFVVFVPLVREQRELFPLPPRHTLRLTPSLMELITMQPLPVRDSRTCVLTNSRSAWTQLRRYFVMQRPPRELLMRLFL